MVIVERKKPAAKKLKPEPAKKPLAAVEPRPAKPPPPTPPEREAQSQRDRARNKANQQAYREKVLKGQIQHQPQPIGQISDVAFSRCRCGLTLATYQGSTYWLRARRDGQEEEPIKDVTEPGLLDYVLRLRCEALSWREVKLLADKESAARRP